MTVSLTNTDTQLVTLQQFFDFVKKSNDEKLDDIVTIKPATKKYIRLFKEHGNKKFFWSWNWSAALFLLYWLAYRKMYSIIFKLIFSALGLYGIIIGLGLLFNFIFTNYFKIPDNTQFIILMVIAIPMLIIASVTPAMLSNCLYINHAKKCIIQNKWNKAGVSKIALWLTIIFICIPSFVFGIIKENRNMSQQKRDSISTTIEEPSLNDDQSASTNL